MEPVFASAARRLGVPEPLLLAVAAQESGFDPDAYSPGGAVGIMQMLPASFALWAPRAGVAPTADPRDPVAEVPAAAAMLAGEGATSDQQAALYAHNPDPAYARTVVAREADYAAWLSGPQPTGRSPVNGWPWGQCTWYVAARRAAVGAPVTWAGDAWQWLAAAQAEGVQATTMPRAGEIAVYRRGGRYDASYGHVALVVAVTNVSYTVAEAHYRGLGVVGTRTIRWPDPLVAGFIP
jgi:surface antigen